MKELIYGKNEMERIVSIECDEYGSTIFTKDGDSQRIFTKNWILYHEKLSDKFQRLAGNQHYKYLMEYEDNAKYQEVLNSSRAKKYDFLAVYNPKEALMLREGYTYYKGMTPADLDVLSFDIETTGIRHNSASQVLLISNTFRYGDSTIRRLFSLDEFESQRDMIKAWCAWVSQMNPSVIVGHNLFGFDLPYLEYVAKMNDTELTLGRDGSAIRFDKRVSQFRKDGSQSYDYQDAHIYGREIVDTFFLSIKYDVQRKYESYSLKAIIKHEGLEKQDRQFYDASTIKDNWHSEAERVKIKAYAIDDADDALALFDLMVPAFFYYAQSVPMPFQRIINTASGRQINNIMVRAYLQQGHSIPKASPAAQYEGAISFGNPGIYKHVYKVDVASLYPSIMLEYRVCDRDKDPDELFLKMVQYFTEQRLENKRLAKETGNRHYNDLQNAQKIVINSAYGFMGAEMLNFNSPRNAALVTCKGREILQTAIKWAEGKDYKIVNVDTDSIGYTSGKAVPDEQFDADLAELNSLFPKQIKWTDDGYYKTVVVVKTKNYVLQKSKGDVEIKGSGLKGSMKEPRLQQFMKDVIQELLKGRKDRLYDLYSRYATEIDQIKDISEWCFRKTVTKSVLEPDRTLEQRVLDAIKDKDVSEGDKLKLFFKSETELCLLENFNGIYDKDTLYGKLHDTLGVFDTLVQTDLFPNYALKRNKELLKCAF